MGRCGLAGGKSLLLAHGGIDAVEAISIYQSLVPYAVEEGELAVDIAAKPHRLAGRQAALGGLLELFHGCVQVLLRCTTQDIGLLGAAEYSMLGVGGARIIGQYHVLVQVRQILIRKLARGGVQAHELFVLGAIRPGKFLRRGAQVDGQDTVDILAGLGKDFFARAVLCGGAAYHGGKIAVHLRGISRRAYLRHDLGRHGTVLGYEVAKEAPPAAIGAGVIEYRGHGAIIPASALFIQQLVEHQVGAL